METGKLLMTDGWKVPLNEKASPSKGDQFPRISPGSQECFNPSPKLFFESLFKKMGTSLIFRKRGSQTRSLVWCPQGISGNWGSAFLLCSYSISIHCPLFSSFAPSAAASHLTFFNLFTAR